MEDPSPPHPHPHTWVNKPDSLPISLLMLGAWNAEMDRTSWMAPTIMMTVGVASHRLIGEGSRGRRWGREGRAGKGGRQS